MDGFPRKKKTRKIQTNLKGGELLPELEDKEISSLNNASYCCKSKEYWRTIVHGLCTQMN